METRRADAEPKAVAGAVRELSSLLMPFRNEPDLYFVRATMACSESTGNRESILNDILTSLKLRTPGGHYISDSVADQLVLKSKVEFDLARYQDAMSDADAAIRINYSRADNPFNDGNVKPNQPATPCAWTQSDFEKLAHLFPKDYRPPLYLEHVSKPRTVHPADTHTISSARGLSILRPSVRRRRYSPGLISGRRPT
jgi:hypothetical protein